MTATLTVKVRTRRVWMLKASCAVGALLRRCGVPEPIALRVVAWGAGRIQIKVGPGRWTNLNGRQIVGLDP